MNVLFQRPVRLGFVPLADCAPILMARELGLFAKHGLRVALSREPGWASVRDKLIYRELEAAHAIAPMLFSLAWGIGSIPAQCVTGLVLNANGNAITLSNRLAEAGVHDGPSFKSYLNAVRGKKPVVLGVVFPFSSHKYLLQRWLWLHGIDPERDVQMAVVPPPQMPANLKAGTIDGYCAGEPWNSVALRERTGWCVATSGDLAPMHPEKVLAVRADYAETCEADHVGLIAALYEACRYCANPANAEHIIDVLAHPEHVNVSRETLRLSFYPERQQPLRTPASLFWGEQVNAPSAEKAAWVRESAQACLSEPSLQCVRGIHSSDLFREDLFHKANQLIDDHMETKNQKSSLGQPLSRRSFLTTASKGLGAAALLGALPKGWAGGLFASDAPEVADVKIGIIALTDCSPFVVAHEKGLFKKYGLNTTIIKGASWAAIRDSLSNGDIQATHMLIGMPIASTMGLGGSPKKPMIVPWLVNRNGQAITLKKELAGKVAEDPKPLKALADAAKAAGTPMTFAMTFPPGTHAMWMRYWLAAGGVHPGNATGGDADISLITIPPPQMVANMQVGKLDGFCVGEPWNARAIADDIGFTAITTQAMWKDHPEKVCAFTEEFAAKNPKTVKAVLKGLHEASVWLDKMENREEQAKIVSAATYINCPPETILGRLQGKYIMGDGRKFRDPNYMIFSDRNCNYPQAKYSKWWLTQLRRWGFTEGAPDYEGVTKQVMRADLYEAAMKEIGYAHGGPDDKAETMFDGITFDPKGNLEAYASNFAIKSLKG